MVSSTWSLRAGRPGPAQGTEAADVRVAALGQAVMGDTESGEDLQGVRVPLGAAKLEPCGARSLDTDPDMCWASECPLVLGLPRSCRCRPLPEPGTLLSLKRTNSPIPTGRLHSHPHASVCYSSLIYALTRHLCSSGVRGSRWVVEQHQKPEQASSSELRGGGSPPCPVPTRSLAQVCSAFPHQECSASFWAEDYWPCSKVQHGHPPPTTASVHSWGQMPLLHPQSAHEPLQREAPTSSPSPRGLVQRPHQVFAANNYIALNYVPGPR